MPVFTAAAIAVSAAIASVSFATVAAAVVAVATAVGVAGMAVTAVGMITGNKDLLGVGKIMSYVGMAGGLAGGLAGGAGGLMEGGAGFVEGVKGAYSGAADAMSEAWKGSIFNPGDGVAVAGAVPETGAAGATGATGVTESGANQPFVGDAAAPSTSVAPGAENIGNAQTIPEQVGSVEPVPLPPATNPIPGWTPAAPPVEPTIPGADSTSLLNLRAGANGQQNLFGSPTAFNLVDPSKTPSGGILSTIPDWVKYSALNTVGQGAAGAASGWYAGASAEQKLEYDKLVNEQRQQQVNYQNKNNAYAPLLSFAK